MKKNMKKDILVMGFAMFAIFFGSGNLIFPPIIGLVSGEQVGWAIIGLALTGILFPMMALASVGKLHVNKKMLKYLLIHNKYLSIVSLISKLTASNFYTHYSNVL